MFSPRCFAFATLTISNKPICSIFVHGRFKFSAGSSGLTVQQAVDTFGVFVKNMRVIPSVRFFSSRVFLPLTIYPVMSPPAHRYRKTAGVTQFKWLGNFDQHLCFRSIRIGSSTAASRLSAKPRRRTRLRWVILATKKSTRSRHALFTVQFYREHERTESWINKLWSFRSALEKSSPPYLTVSQNCSTGLTSTYELEVVTWAENSTTCGELIAAVRVVASDSLKWSVISGANGSGDECSLCTVFITTESTKWRLRFF